jgi:hypothetical protein
MLSLPSAGTGCGGILLAPVRGHIPSFIMRLRSALEADMNLGSLLPARRCCVAHVSTGSSTHSMLSSDLYIVIKSPRVCCRWELWTVYLRFGMVIVDE